MEKQIQWSLKKKSRPIFYVKLNLCGRTKDMVYYNCGKYKVNDETERWFEVKNSIVRRDGSVVVIKD